MSPVIAFRADASKQIGTGHIMRCLTLADALQSAGAQCRFFCQAHEGNLLDLISNRGHAAVSLPKTKGFTIVQGSDPTHAGWLGTDQQTDAEQTTHLLHGETVDWFIVDHYALDYRWEKAMQHASEHIMVIDDLADRKHHCHLLLDQNFGSSATRYTGLTESDCMQMHGPEYALLKPIYAERTQSVKREGGVKRVLIYFGGGADTTDLTGLAFSIFNATELQSIEVDIVVGATYAHESTLRAAVAKRGLSTMHKQLPDLAELMANADLAIGAGGATTWERCCLGLPSLVISIADNQRPACEALASASIIRYLGEAPDISAEQLLQEVLSLCESNAALQSLSAASRNLVDGHGVQKVIQKMGYYKA